MFLPSVLYHFPCQAKAQYRLLELVRYVGHRSLDTNRIQIVGQMCIREDAPCFL